MVWAGEGGTNALLMGEGMLCSWGEEGKSGGGAEEQTYLHLSKRDKIYHKYYHPCHIRISIFVVLRDAENELFDAQY